LIKAVEVFCELSLSDIFFLLIVCIAVVVILDEVCDVDELALFLLFFQGNRPSCFDKNIALRAAWVCSC